MKDFKYINSLSTEVAEIRLYKRIGAGYDEAGYYMDGVNGADFASEMAWLQDKCKKINVRINSGGGSVLDGYAIVSSILNSKVPVNTYVDGLAASMAAVIAVCGKKVYMADYAMFMIHNVNGDDKAIAGLFTETINKILSGRTGMDAESMATMMNDETWMNASQCKDKGFIDEIIDTNARIKAKMSNNVNELYSYFNEILNPKTNNMKNITNVLKLAENASEVDMVNAINAKDAELVKLQNENKALKEAAEKMENEKKEALKNKATKLVNDAKDAGKIAEAEVAELLENASNSESGFGLVEKLLSKIDNKKTAANITNTITGGEGDAKSKWTFLDWSKNDPKGLENMQKNEPAKFTKLLNEYTTK